MKVSTTNGITTTETYSSTNVKTSSVQENPVDPEEGLGAGAIAGIIIAVIAVGALIFFGVRHHQKKKHGDNYHKAK